MTTTTADVEVFKIQGQQHAQTRISSGEAMPVEKYGDVHGDRRRRGERERRYD